MLKNGYVSVSIFCRLKYLIALDPADKGPAHKSEQLSAI